MNRKRTLKVVIVEDNPFYNKILEKYVKTLCSSKFYPEYEFDVKSYLTAEDCIENLEDDTDIMLLDYLLVDDDKTVQLNGGDVLREVNENCHNCKVIMISGQKNMIITVELMKKGVYEYVDKSQSDSTRIGAIIQDIIKDRSKLSA